MCLMCEAYVFRGWVERILTTQFVKNLYLKKKQTNKRNLS
jgi:hypothetical protein